MTTDHLLERHWTPQYTCRHFLVEAWQCLTGEDLTVRLPRLLDPVARLVDRTEHSAFRLLNAPASPCIVLMQQPKTDGHVGIYIDSKIMHLTEDKGMEYLPALWITKRFNKVRYYK